MLFLISAGLFLVDLMVPDFIPFADEVLLGLATALTGLAIAMAGWLLFGLAFWLLGAALAPLSGAELGLFIFTLASSIILGLAVLFVPGGLGVRESIMVFLLTSAGLPSALTVVAAALLRLAVLLAELVGAFTLKIGLRLVEKKPPAGRIPQKDY